MDPLLTLTVATVLHEPFIFLRDDNVNRTGNDQYQGFLIDLLENISNRTSFEFVLKLQEDGRYGMQLDDGNWNGLIGSVASAAVDIGLADMTITSGREKAVDFSIPYMQTGIQILYKPYRRMNTFSSIEDLVNQTDIKFGCVKGGSTEKFFKNSNNPVYRKAWEIMKENFQQEMSVNVEEGIEMVLDNPGGYAFLLEAQNAQHAVNKNCGLKIVGPRINTRHFGLVVQRDSGLRKTLNIALLQMMEEDVLAELEKTWFGRRNSECRQISSYVLQCLRIDR